MFLYVFGGEDFKGQRGHAGVGGDTARPRGSLGTTWPTLQGPAGPPCEALGAADLSPSAPEALNTIAPEPESARGLPVRVPHRSSVVSGGRGSPRSPRHWALDPPTRFGQTRGRSAAGLPPGGRSDRLSEPPALPAGVTDGGKCSCQGAVTQEHACNGLPGSAPPPVFPLPLHLTVWPAPASQSALLSSPVSLSPTRICCRTEACQLPVICF